MTEKGEMTKMTENMNNGCSQRDSSEYEEYAKASRSFNRIWKERDSAQPKLLEAILYKDNFSQSIKTNLEGIKVYVRGWLNYYGIARMKNSIEDINGWIYHRIRMCIWKQWKKPKTKIRNLLKMGVPMELAR